MSEPTLVSVIVPTYNRPGMLGRALKSLQAQTWAALEILVVDDNPPESEAREETRRFIQEFLTDPRIRYIERSENGGGALARNTGIEASRGEYLAFLDDDDEFLPEKIEKQLALFGQSDQSPLGVVYCATAYVDGEGEPLYEGCPGIRGDALAFHLRGTLGSTGSFLFSREAVVEAGLFEDVPASQEYILIYKILKKGYLVDYLEEPLFRMYLHDFGRITTGKRKIEGKMAAFHMMEEDIKSLLSPSDRRKTYYDHYYDLFFLYLKEKNRREWRRSLFLALKTHCCNKRNLLMFLALLLGFENFMKLKMRTKKAVL